MRNHSPSIVSIAGNQRCHTKRSYSRADRQRYYALWLKCDVSKTKFCRQHGLKLPTFCNWVTTIEKSHAMPSFRKVEVESSASPAASSKSGDDEASPQALDVTLPSGLSLRTANLSNIDSVVSLLRGLGYGA